MAGGGRRLGLFFVANVLFGAGLFAHAFLYNFYLQALGLDPAVMGAAAAALTAGGLTALVPAGMLADRMGPARAYGVAAILGGLGLTAGALVTGVPAVLAAAFLAGAGTAFWRVSMGPLAMRIAQGDRRARAFSWNVALLLASGAVWTAGAGSLPAWLEQTLGVSQLAGIRAAMLSGAAGTAASALAIGLLRLPPHQAQRDRVEAGDGVRPSFAASLRVPGPILLAVLGVTVWMCAGGLVIPFFNIFFRQEHDLSIARIGVLFATAQAVQAIAVFASGEAASRWGARRVLLFWSVLFTPLLWSLTAAAALPLLIALFLVQGFVPPATNPLIDQLLLERTSAARHGVVSSWRNAATELSGMVGAGTGGFMLRAAGFDALFATAGAVALLGAIALWSTLLRLAPGSGRTDQSESADRGRPSVMETLPRSSS